MATDRRPAYADIDEDLFDVDRIPRTTRDVRSVGEMLLDIDYLARQLLMDVNGDDAGPLLRNWPTMVAAAEVLWTSLPGGRTGNDERDRSISRLSAQAATIERRLTGRKAWPGQGPTNPVVDQMAQTLVHAAALVRRYGADIPYEQPEAHRDIEAARTRIMHGLYLATHAVNVALHENGRDRVNDARESGRRVQLAQHHSPYAVAPTGVWIDRMSACENTAHSYLTDRFAQALAGEAIPTVDDPSRLAQALATWDIQSHRALARDLAPANILLITRTQGLITSGSMALVDAAATAGILEPPDRLAAAIAEASRSWSNLASRWGDLAPPSARVEEPLARAAAEVRAAYRQITHDTTTLATPQVIATRPGLSEATMATLRAIESSSELAHVIAEKADTPNLTGPARTLSIRAHNDVEAGLVANPPEGDVVWISPTDILARRNVPIPPRVRASLRTASGAAESASRTAAATAGLTIANAFGGSLDVAPTFPAVDPTPKRGGSLAEPAPSQHGHGGGPPR